MSAILIRLEPVAITATWPRIESWIADAAERSHGRYTAALIRAYAERGLWQLWLAIDETKEICAVGGTRIITYDTGLKTLFVMFGTGRNRKAWQHFMDDFLAYGKSQGCTLAEGSFRKGWRRIFPGWTHTHDFLERVL